MQKQIIKNKGFTKTNVCDKLKNDKERCPSGLRCNLGKVVWEQFHRGFESHPL